MELYFIMDNSSYLVLPITFAFETPSLVMKAFAFSTMSGAISDKVIVPFGKFFANEVPGSPGPVAKSKIDGDTLVPTKSLVAFKIIFARYVYAYTKKA